MALTEFEIKNAKPKEKTYALSDGRGLILEVRPNGRKYWVARLWDEKEKRKGLGTYPEISLREARDLIYEKRQALKTGVSSETFETVAEEWYKNKIKHDLSASYARTVRIRLDTYLLPKFRKDPLSEITPGRILALCRDCEAKDMTDTAHRLRQFMKQIFDYAIATDRIEINPAASISKALKKHKQEHYAALTSEDDIRALLTEIEQYPRVQTRLALKLSALTAVRPINIRTAEWKEIDIIRKEWRIPASKMKQDVEHVVPLSKQAVAIIDELKPLTGNTKWLFPSARLDGRPMSNNTIRIALRAMGYEKNDMTAHGFRAMFSTVMNRFEWNADVIEELLAHKEKDAVRRAYNRERYFPHKLSAMQWWSDYLDAIIHNKPAPKKPKVTIKM